MSKGKKMRNLAILLAALLVLTCGCSQASGTNASTEGSKEPVTTAAEPQTTKEAVPETETSAETSGTETSGQVDLSIFKTTTQQYLDKMDEIHEEYAPKIITLPSGVEVQRTPTEYGPSACSILGDTAYNNYRLDADNRGCLSCHRDLAETVSNMDVFHTDIASPYGNEMTVTQCLNCHTHTDYYQSDIDQFGTMIHGIHYSSKAVFNGNCYSCHAATGDGKGIVLWDQAKYSLMRGITAVSSEELEAFNYSFSFDQDVISDVSDGMFAANWYAAGTLDDTRQDAVALGQESYIEQIDFDNWEIMVSGLVKEPRTFTLGELIKQAEADEQIVVKNMKYHCTYDMIGEGLIQNVEITGIPLSYICEQLCGGLDPSVTYFNCTAQDGNFTLQHALERESYLVYLVNGEYTRYSDGYPVSLWVESGSCGMDIKQISFIEACTGDDYYEYLGQDWTEDFKSNNPNCTILNTEEGAIIPIDQPYTVEGFADAYNYAITAIQVSFDQGETWIEFPTEGATSDRWVYWYFTFTPAEKTAYVMQVRAIDEVGNVSPFADVTMVNVR